MTGTASPDRRTLLGAAGLAAAVAAVPSLGLPPPARAAAPDALTLWTLDTMSGLAAFVMPGPDAYSRAQGTPRREPGGIEARTPEFLVDALDRYLPVPDLPAASLARGLLAAVPGDAGAGGTPLLRSDASVPLSPVVALLLNVQALRVAPWTVAGPFRTPFARLSFDRKARVFELLEGADPDLVEILDARLPEPLRRTASGLLRFLGGALLELTALGGYSEWAVWDRDARELRGTPVGWRVSGYTPAAEGRPEFRGYYQGRREATG
ncbi:hypothetical protein [Actinomadura flavalba]|uniref:hypothetical protein n=1 Tax=Actinomadura flavalba TaxID=1120938 RepID=UPI00036292C4|nr:hypothetical protein [Actinomadura flavalba]